MAISDDEKKKRQMRKPKISESEMTGEEIKEEREKKFNEESTAMEANFKDDISFAKKIEDNMKDQEISYELNVMTFVNKLIEFKLDVLKDTPWMGFVGDGDMAKNWKAMFEEWDQETVAKSQISVRW